MEVEEFRKMRQSGASVGKPAWRPMLEYVALLHEKSVFPPKGHLPYEWEDIGPGYCYGPAFGHWDLVHAMLDELPYAPVHVRKQLLNLLSGQREDGFVTGTLWMKKKLPEFSPEFGHPPLWPVVAEALAELEGSDAILEYCLPRLIRQIGWFEQARAAQPQGFYYLDILTHDWESGIDEGIRFLDIKPGPLACVDACAHVYLLYDCAQRWSLRLGQAAEGWTQKAQNLRGFIREKLFSVESGFFHDIWAAADPALRCFAFEGMWPLVVGAASPEQATAVIDQNLLNPQRFFSAHPIRTVAATDPRYEIRMWRGPAWNSMTYWAAYGCLRYHRPDAARTLLERALDSSAAQFARTGTIWEFYHPESGDQQTVERKPHTQQNTPCRDYLGHNPLLAMARLYESSQQAESERMKTPSSGIGC